MNKLTCIVGITFIAFSGMSYTPKGLPEPHTLTNFNIKGGALAFGIKTVCIDAGHGGKDPGCIGITGTKEKEVTLAIALKLGKYIEQKTPDVKVIHTRTTDVFVELDERAAIANKHKADLFISIHCNTACSYNKKSKKITCNEMIAGAETYVMGLHKTSANLNVAKRENEAIFLEKDYRKRYGGFDPNDEAGYILMTLQQNVYHKQSVNFAAKVQKQVNNKAGRTDKGVHQAGFLVLWRTAMPSVLIETEFLSNPDAEKFMSSEKGQDLMARAIFSAFREYKDEVEGKFVKYEDEIENTKADFVINESEKINKDTASQKMIDKNETQQYGKNEENKREPVIDYDERVRNAFKDSALGDTAHTVKKNLTDNKDAASFVHLKHPDEKKNESINSIQKEGYVVYKVQFMSSSSRIPMLSEKFKGLKDVSEYEDGGTYKYTAGEFKTLDDAMRYRSEMQSKGFKDCFVVKFKDGKRIKNN